MSKYYIMVVEEPIRAFSMVGHGNSFNYEFAVKGQTTPFEGLETGDKIVGYISNTKKTFSYLFDVEEVHSESECSFIKTLEISRGAELETLSEAVKQAIYESEQKKSFVMISNECYREIVDAMLNSLSSEYGCESLTEETNTEEIEYDESKRLVGGRNVLLYGVPGCGKSYTIQTKYCKDVDGIERVVFHPDFTYGDFVGQILPITKPNNTIEYIFSPGPFSRILYEAYNNPEKKYCLVIEELNRGNAPAIFGDIFQLLDRDEQGTSSYSISNTDIAGIVYSGNKSRKVFIPSNLSILATMNTSDQNVFTLDTAFQRRWKMRMIENDVDKATAISNLKILDTSITWSRFNKVINAQILVKNMGMTSSEDKRLGAYFVSSQDLIYQDPTAEGLSAEQIEEANDNNHNFPEKVLKYLWDDAFKFTRQEVFKEEYTSLEQLISAFESATGDDRFGIFVDDIFNLNN